MPEIELTHSELLRCLDYTPATGLFTWRIPPSRRVAAGAPAGTSMPDGRCVVGLHGKRYYGHRLAWFYVNSAWPPEGQAPRFRDFDVSNCAIDNIYYVTARLSTDPRAVSSRRLRRHQREIERQNLNRQNATSPITNVARSPLTGQWVVYHPEDISFTFEIGRTAKLGDALAMYYERRAGCDFVETSPAPRTQPTDATTYAGNPGSLSLAEAHAWLAYDPRTGAFYHRMAHSKAGSWRSMHLGDPVRVPMKHLGTRVSEGIKGLRADELNTNGSPVIGFFGRDYSAASLAVFMQTGIWPKRRGIEFADGNKTNTAWANLSNNVQGKIE